MSLLLELKTLSFDLSEIVTHENKLEADSRRPWLIVAQNHDGDLVQVFRSGLDDHEGLDMLDRLSGRIGASDEPLMVLSTGADGRPPCVGVRLDHADVTHGWLVSCLEREMRVDVPLTAHDKLLAASLGKFRALAEMWTHFKSAAVRGFLASIAPIAPISLVLTPSLNVLGATQAAHRLLADNPAISIRHDGRLALAKVETTRLLAHAVLEVTGACEDQSPGIVSIEADDEAPGWLGIIRPYYSVGRDEMPCEMHGEPLVWLELRDITVSRLPSDALLRKAFSLTKREAEVVRGLMVGQTAAAQAEEARVGVDAVNYHLKNIRQKLGCRKQSQIVQRVFALLG